MGWIVIAKGQIDFPKDTPERIVKQVYRLIEKSKIGEDGEVFYNLSKYFTKKHGGQIAFEMSGNKGINYEPIDEIKSFILKKLEGKNKVGLIININEFCEAGDGFYFEYEEAKIESVSRSS